MISFRSDPKHPLRHPARILAVAGFAILLVGDLAPWVIGIDTSVRAANVTLNGFSQAGDGGMALLAGVVMLVILRSPAAAESRTRVVQVLPTILGLLAVAFIVITVRNIGIMTNSLKNHGLEPHVEWGLGLALVGAIVMAAGGLATTILVTRQYPIRGRVGDTNAFDIAFAIRLILALTGVIAGAVVGVTIALWITHSSAHPLVPLLGMIGILPGLALGNFISRRLTAEPTQAPRH